MRSLNNILVIITLWIFNTQISAQYASEKSLLEVANNSMLTKNYYDALNKYKELLEFDENKIYYLYQTAEAARLHGAYAISRKYYELVLKHEENNIYPVAAFHLGQVTQLQGDYQAAKMAYLLYRTEHNNENEYLLNRADKEITACEWALSQIDNQNLKIKFNRLGDQINSSHSDFAATGIGEYIKFSSDRFENTFNTSYPKRTISNFLESKNGSQAQLLIIPNVFFLGKGLANATYSKNQSKVIYSVCVDLNDHDKRCQLYMSSMNASGLWDEPQKLPEFINVSEKTTTQPCLSIDPISKNEVLYFVSDREGGKGMLDIWYSVLDQSGAFSEPINVAAINTLEDDVTPFYHSESSTLYFSSRGYLGFGGQDIFSTVKGKSTWANPSNLGSPINSSYDDVYFFLGDSNKVLFSSNRTESKFIDDINQACCYDIYQAIMPNCDVKLKALIYDAITLADLKGATIQLIEIGNKEFKPIVLKYDTSNVYSIPLDCNKEYKIEVSKSGYSTEALTFLSGRPGEFAEILKKIFLKPEPLKLDVLTFNKQDSLPLNGCNLSLIDLDDSTRQPILITNLNSNLFQFVIVTKGHRYKIIANREDYAMSSLELKIDSNATGIIEQKLYLEKFLVSLLPLNLYFDNDRPRPVKTIVYTNLSYSETYKTYFPKQKLFILRYCALNPTNINTSCSKDMESFFIDSLKGGKDILELFLERLALDLGKGKKYEIFIKGYASPLASNIYNINLGKRRIQSLRNEFNKYNKGILVKYLKSGLLVITERSFGEETAPIGISFEDRDPGSIYHINASRERRVVIEEIK